MAAPTMETNAPNQLSTVLHDYAMKHQVFLCGLFRESRTDGPVFSIGLRHDDTTPVERDLLTGYTLESLLELIRRSFRRETRLLKEERELIEYCLERSGCVTLVVADGCLRTVLRLSVETLTVPQS